MQLVEIRILKTIFSSQYGTLSHGDLLRCGDAYARHLVEDLAAAKYVQSQQIAPKQQKTPEKPARRARKPAAPAADPAAQA